MCTYSEGGANDTFINHTDSDEEHYLQPITHVISEPDVVYRGDQSNSQQGVVYNIQMLPGVKGHVESDT